MTERDASFLRAARAGNLEKVLEYLKGSIDINSSNANGLNALHLASKEGHVSVVTELLKRGANVNAATKKGNTALHIASLAGQEEVVKLLIQNGSNVNVQSLNGFSPLYMAAQENHDSVVRYLLANGANQSLATEDGFTPLAVALQQGHDKVVAVLLENDTKGKVRLPALHVAAKKDDCKAAALLLQNDHNPDVTSKSGFTPLHIASHYGNENIASLLLDKNADVNFVAKHQITPIHVAAKWGKANMVTLLLDRKAKIDAATRDGLTPLHCAARSGHESVVDLLLERNAPISAKTKNGLAPLHMAAQGDHVDSARILLFHKAPVDDITVDYLTALHVAAHCGHVRVAKLLLDRKADPNARALNGFTPLHIACKKNRIKVVELLLKHGASIEATTESGLTPLHVAAFMGCMNIVIYLIQHGANPDVPTVRGESPLHLAARANQTDIIRILLRNGAQVDAKAREHQTPLHIASRLGNIDIVGLLLQHGASVDALTKDMYTSLHIAAKEGQEEVASVLLDHGASLTAATKKGFTPLHLAAKYGNIKVARLLLSKDAPVDAQGKNNVTPLHCAAHYDHVNVALLLLEKGASPHATAKNGYCPLHIAARKNQMDIATTLLEYGAKANAESKAGFTPLHLAAQEGHTDMAALLIAHQANVNSRAKNSLTPLHLCAQEDRVNVASILVKNRADIIPQTKAGYTPLHVACHFGQINMIRFLLQNGADVNATNAHGYTPLHQAAQQGHTLIVNLLLEHKASPNVTTNQGQTALSIAQRLGYISVVETLKVVTETVVTTTTTTVTEEKYKVIAPETMQETFMSDSEDEGGEEFVEETTLYSGNAAHSSHVYLPYYESQKLPTSDDNMLGDQSYRYLTADEMKSLGDDSLPFDVTKDERGPDSLLIKDFLAPITVEEEHLSPHHLAMTESYVNALAPDNIDISRAPITAGTFKYRDVDFSDQQLWHYHIRPLDPSLRMRRSRRLKWKTFLVSFMVDARGGAMRGCRHSGVRVIIPPRKASMPMRITCRYLRKEKLIHPPPLMEGEACASRLLEVGPIGAKFLGPVIIEVPHFASLRGKEREIIILRSDNGETWREHALEASEDAVQEVLNESFEGENDVNALDDFSSNRITRILTTDFPQYFAVITRIRQEVHAIGPEGGMVSSTVVPQVQAIFPEGALTKKIKVGLQAQPIPSDLVTKMLGNRVAVSPICTIEPRRRKFHKPITLTIPVPQAATRGMINQYSGDAPTLRLLCSITGSTKSGGTTKAQWEDVTGSTPLTFVNDCVSFTSSVSARFWLIDCRQVNEATKFATELYQEAIHVPFMSKFVVFAKRYEPLEAQLRVFCMTDDKEEKTLENQEHFTEVAKSRDVEVLESKPQYLEFAGNLVPVTKSGEQLSLTFQAFRENRLPFVIRVKDPHQEPLGRIAFMREHKKVRTEQPQVPICNLNIELPDICKEDASSNDFVTVEKNYDFVKETKLSTPDMISKADLYFADVSKALGSDWINLAHQLDIPLNEVERIQSNYPNNNKDQALAMLRFWSNKVGPTKANGKALEKGLRAIRREDIIAHSMSNTRPATDSLENAIHKIGTEQNVFDSFKYELGPTRDTSRGAPFGRDVSVDIYDEQDIMKEAESAEESGSEAGVSSLRSYSNSADKDRGRHTSVSETDEEENERRRLEDSSERAIAAQKFLEFLEEEDKEDSETRAKYRGEDIDSQQELFVVKEEMVIPLELHSNSREEPTETTTYESTSILDDGTIKHTITAVTKTTVVPDQSEPLTYDQTGRLIETETWHSGEQDTSQVSVSSLPEDEKSEPSTATVSSSTTTHTGDNVASALVTTSLEDEPRFDVMVEQKEWTEEDENGVHHIIEQSSSLTTENGRDKFQLSSHDVMEEPESDSQTLSFDEKKNFFEKLSFDTPVASSPNRPKRTYSHSISVDEQLLTNIRGENQTKDMTLMGEVIEEQLSFQEKMQFFRKSLPQESSDCLPKFNVSRAKKAETNNLLSNIDTTSVSMSSDRKFDNEYERQQIRETVIKQDISESLFKSSDVTTLSDRDHLNDDKIDEIFVKDEELIAESTKTHITSSPTANNLERQQIPRSFLPSNVGLDDHDECDKSFIPKPSPPEVVAAIDEQLSPVVDYPTNITPELQVKVGVSPTEHNLIASESTESEFYARKDEVYDYGRDDQMSESKHSFEYINTTDDLAKSGLAYENDAFAGAENIDSADSVDSGERSPYEVVREDVLLDLNYSVEQSFQSQETRPKFIREQLLDRDDETDLLGDKALPQTSEPEITAQKKELEGKVVKHIVSEIFAKELEEEIVNGSPERKIIRTNKEINQKCVNWQTSAQQDYENVSELKFDSDYYKLKDNNAKQSRRVGYDDSQIYDEELRREASIIAQSIVGKATEELLKRPHLVTALSDISDEDLVEKGDEDKLDFDLLSPSNEEHQSVDSAKQSQKRISFTEHETFIIKEESFEGTNSVIQEQTTSTDELKRKSSDSGSRSSGSQKEKESGSSPDSHYHSFDVSDSSKTPITSRPTSSEFDLTIIPEQYCLSADGSGSGQNAGLSASEYETCATSQEGSYMTAASQESSTYHTAQSHASSRDSTISIESESSGHLGEASSEASETLIFLDEKEPRVSSSDDDFDPNESTTPVNDEFKEPFDCNIPESVIRSGVEVPFMSGGNWEVIEQSDPECHSSSSTFEIITGDEIDEFAQQTNAASSSGLRRQSNSVDDGEQSENSNTWQSSSVGTAIHIPDQNIAGSVGHSSSCTPAESIQSNFRSFSESISSLENLNGVEVQQTIQESSTYSNGPIEVEYNPEYDVSDSDRANLSSTVTVRHPSTSQDDRTSSSDLLSDAQASNETPLVSQSSLCSSVLSEHTRHQLSYDLSPEVGMCVADSLTLGSDDLQRPQSPVPPEAEDFVYLDLSKDASNESFQQKSPTNESLAPNIETHSCEHSELYTHHEIDEDLENSVLASRLNASRGIPFSRSGESSAASSLKEFERLEAELLSKGRASFHGSSDSIGSSYSSGRPIAGRSSDRDDQSVGSSLNEFEKLEKDCSEAERIEKVAQEEAARLSEIEEGHESQSSEASQETLSDRANTDDDSDSDDYEKRMSEIDDIMKKAQNNVERMHGMSNESDKQIKSDSFTDNNLSDDKLSTQKSQNANTSSAHKMLAKKIVSMESFESHPRSSISTTNTESLIGRMEDLDENRVEDKEQDSIDGYRDGNKSFESDSLSDDHDKRDVDRDSLQDVELATDCSSEGATSSGPLTSFVQEVLAIASLDTGPALATLREENDFDEDSLKGSFHGILKGGECMLSSTDSLEPTSSDATHATYQIESDALMSTSYYTSGDEATMISSSELPDMFAASPEIMKAIEEENQLSEIHGNQLRQMFQRERQFAEDQSGYERREDNNDDNNGEQFEEIRTFDEKGNMNILKRVKRTVPPQTSSASSSSANEERFFEMLKNSAEPGVEEIIEQKSFDDSGSLIITRTVKRIATQGPEIKTRLLSGDSADKDNEEFLESFSKLDTTVNVDEYEGIDESGNPYRVYQEVTVTPEVRAVTFTGPDAKKKLEEFMNTWSGDKNELKEINVPFSGAETSQSDSVNVTQSDFGKYNGQSDNEVGSSRITGSTRVVTETVSEENGHTTTMETTVHHSQEADQLRQSMQHIVDQFMKDNDS